ncbi:unnamed protein product, partial [Heterosigma akashiwo]
SRLGALLQRRGRRGQLGPPSHVYVHVSSAGWQDWLKAQPTSKKTATSTSPPWIIRSTLITAPTTQHPPCPGGSCTGARGTSPRAQLAMTAASIQPYRPPGSSCL